MQMTLAVQVLRMHATELIKGKTCMHAPLISACLLQGSPRERDGGRQ